MARDTAKVKLPSEIRRLLSAVRWRIRAYVWAEGVSLGVIWVGVTFWASLALDYLPVLLGASEMPREARAVLLALIAVVLALILYRWVLRRTFVRLADRSMAVLLERRFDQFHDSLITSVELRDRPMAEVNREMLTVTEEDALANLRRVKPANVFNLRPLLASLAGAAGFIVTVALFYAVNAHALEIGVKRIYLLEDEPWPRNAHIEVVGVEVERLTSGPADSAIAPLVRFDRRRVKVAKGSNAGLLVRADASAKKVPDVCTIYYNTLEGHRGRVNMTQVGGIRNGYRVFKYGGKPLKGILSDVAFDVVGFDHRVRDYMIEVVDSPTIIEAELDCKFPRYMVDVELSSWLPRTIQLASGTQLPRGTEVTIRARSNKELQKVYLHNPDSGETMTLEPEGAGQERCRFEYRAARLDRNLSLEVTLVDVDNVVSERPHHIYIVAIEDEPPVVDVRLQGIGTAVTPDVVIPAKGKIGDDYGVAKSWFEVVVNDGAVREQRVELDPAGVVDASIDFRQQRNQESGVELRPKDKLHLTIKAVDKHDLGGGPNVGIGDHYQLDVVTAEELLAILEARELGLRRRFEQIVDETKLMHDSLIRTKTDGAGSSPAGSEPEDTAPDRGDAAKAGDDTDKAEAELKRARSLRLLRAQRALLQSQKSAQETLGVAASFGDIREELINNRVDTEDRKKRLKEQIADPLQRIGEIMFPELDRRLEALLEVMDGGSQARPAKSEDDPETVTRAEAAIQQAGDILLEMDKVLQSMLDLETYNELLEIVRSLIADQERLLDETKKQQKKQVLDLLE